MYSTVFSGTWEGIHGTLIQVEADMSNGLPVFEMVGYLSSEVKEAKERVRTALKNQGFTLPPQRITVNLAPAHIRKSGSSYDLAVGIAVLIAAGYLTPLPEPVLFLGEVGLNGSLKAVQGVLPVVLCAREEGIRLCLVPKENTEEASIAKDMLCVGIDSVGEAVRFLQTWIKKENKDQWMEKYVTSISKKSPAQKEEEDSWTKADFCHIKGQRLAKRAIEIAVSGHHNLLMTGSPGSGKSALAKRIPSIMPSLNDEEKLELTKIYSICGKLCSGQMIDRRPYRSPHHSISVSALAGGGRNAGPGEISLAHKGVLFLDELPEFQRQTLDMLRQPLEERKIVVSRNRRTCIYPADFMLVGAMNPCPCGYYPDRSSCFCSEKQIRNYQNKISGPILDRIDIMVQIHPVPFRVMREEAREENSAVIQKRVEKVRNLQKVRYQQEKYQVNAHLDEEGMEKYCIMSGNCEDMLEEVIRKNNLSYRSYGKILKLARTIADMEESGKIHEKHMAEAIMFRMGWQNGKKS